MDLLKENPQQLRSESEKILAKHLRDGSIMALRMDSSSRFARRWLDYNELKRRVEEQLQKSRLHYREVLKKTESAALSGRPRLYWIAKALFAKLRFHSLEYQLAEAQLKQKIISQKRDELAALARRLDVSLKSQLPAEVDDAQMAEQVSREHSSELNAIWDGENKLLQTEQELSQRLLDLELKLANSQALVAESFSSHAHSSGVFAARIVDSPAMLTSALPYLGFANKAKLLSLVEQCEYAAEHAERDLEKVREGLCKANEAWVAGRPSRTTREWLDYCRVIVARYAAQLEASSTPG